MKIKEKATAIPMIKVGPSGRIPALVTVSGAFAWDGFPDFVPLGLACLEGVNIDALNVVLDGGLIRPVVERKE